MNSLNTARGVGFTVKQVTVKQVDSVKLLALCQDTEGQYIEVAVKVRRVIAEPLAGQTWLIDRAMGVWAFAALISDTFPNLPASANGTDLALTGTLTAADVIVTKLLSGGDGFYQDLTLDGAKYVAFGGVYATPGYTKLVTGTIRLCGYLKPATGYTPVGEVIFTLPPGYAPSYSQQRDLRTSSGATFASLRFDPDGTANLLNISGALSWLGLDGIELD